MDFKTSFKKTDVWPNDTLFLVIEIKNYTDSSAAVNLNVPLKGSGGTFFLRKPREVWHIIADSTDLYDY